MTTQAAEQKTEMPLECELREIEIKLYKIFRETQDKEIQDKLWPVLTALNLAIVHLWARGAKK